MKEKRDSLIRKKINDIGRESFPDHDEVNWKILTIEHVDSFSFVEAKASPEIVELPQVIFVVQFNESDQLSVVGCYTPDITSDGFLGDGVHYGLLFTKPNTSDDWRHLLFEETQFLEKRGVFSEHEREKIVQVKIADIHFGYESESWKIVSFSHDEKHSFVVCSPEPPQAETYRSGVILAFTESGYPVERATLRYDDLDGKWELSSTSCPVAELREWEQSFPDLEFEWPEQNAHLISIENLLFNIGVILLGAVLLWWLVS